MKRNNNEKKNLDVRVCLLNTKHIDDYSCLPTQKEMNGSSSNEGQFYGQVVHIQSSKNSISTVGDSNSRRL